jgi:hypothetical protein
MIGSSLSTFLIDYHNEKICRSAAIGRIGWLGDYFIAVPRQ